MATTVTLLGSPESFIALSTALQGIIRMKKTGRVP
jgi:hypothetical protein